jgi:hypothetical protein
MDSIPIRDIHLPPLPGWWPPALGWWLGLFILVALFIFIPWLRKKLAHRSMQQQAMNKFLAINNQYQSEQDKTILLQNLSILLRRICMTYSCRQQTASLINEQWLSQLDAISTKSCISPELGKLLANGPYQKQPDYNADELLRCCRNWIQSLPEEIKNPVKGKGA